MRADRELEARILGRSRGSRLDDNDVFIVKLVEARTDVTPNKLVVRLAEERGIRKQSKQQMLKCGRKLNAKLNLYGMP